MPIFIDLKWFTLYFAPPMKKDHKELVEQLELLRLEKKIPQTQLAEKLGVAFSTVNRWFNGRSQPSSIQREHVRKMLGKKP